MAWKGIKYGVAKWLLHREMNEPLAEDSEKAVESAIERTISEALMVNPRTEYVRQFEFVWNGDAVSVSFVVKGVDIDEFKVSI